MLERTYLLVSFWGDPERFSTVGNCCCERGAAGTCRSPPAHLQMRAQNHKIITRVKPKQEAKTVPDRHIFNKFKSFFFFPPRCAVVWTFEVDLASRIISFPQKVNVTTEWEHRRKCGNKLGVGRLANREPVTSQPLTRGWGIRERESGGTPSGQ